MPPVAAVHTALLTLAAEGMPVLMRLLAGGAHRAAAQARADACDGRTYTHPSLLHGANCCCLLQPECLRRCRRQRASLLAPAS